MRILAVDDDPVSLELLEVLVAQIGDHDITCADSAVEALSLIGTSEFARFDCMLLDVQMPGMSGIELCDLLRSTAAYSDTPILMVTKMGEKSFIDDAFKAGASDYLNKPFEISELRGRINILSRVAEANRSHTGKIFCAKKLNGARAASPDFGLHSPIQITDIEGVIDYAAMENYVGQLSRNSQFGSAVFALKILGSAEIFDSVTPFEFKCLVTDVAEAISLSFDQHHALTAYSGNGTFVCVVDGGWRPDLNKLVDRIQHYFANMDAHLNDGTPINAYLCAGRYFRLLSRSGDRAVDALCEAQEAVEKVSVQMEQSPLGMCTAQYSA